MKQAAALIAVTVAASGAALAKLPPPSDDAKAKAAETAARAKWTESVGAFQLCKAQDRVAAAYRTQKGVKPVAAAASGAAVAAPAACQDPGPFVYKAPEDKPLEASGAHSPPNTATTPPSTPVPHGQAAPKK